MQTFCVTPELQGERIDKALFQIMKTYSRSYATRLIQKNLVRINEKIAQKGNRVKSGDMITVQPLVVREGKFEAKNIPLEIVYEDEDLLVVNKPAGLLTHPSAHEREDTLVNALLHHCGNRLSGIGGEKRPGIVHRLDKNTSGLLVVAKHDEAHRDLAKEIQSRKIKKTYLALVKGIFNSSKGTIEAPLVKHHQGGTTRVIITPSQDAKPSTTHFEVLKTFQDRYSLVQVDLVTGRMHQIRVHFAAIEHPVVGDPVYGDPETNVLFQGLGLTRQFLHAQCLAFHHPRTGALMKFEAPLPSDLQSILAKLSGNPEKYLFETVMAAANVVESR